ncbi:MAG: hypothetical protein OXU45_06645 [Candidatus Melainabacteria bacterium]|nr:hypothetical protein [Candidatus Melainabacteria bacterium]
MTNPNPWHPSNRLKDFWADPKFKREWRRHHEPNTAIEGLSSERDEIQRWFKSIDESLEQYRQNLMSIINESSLNGVWSTDISRDMLKYRDFTAEHEAGDLSRGNLIETSTIAEISLLIYNDPTKLAHTDLFKRVARQLRSNAHQIFSKKDLVELFIRLKKAELKSTN